MQIRPYWYKVIKDIANCYFTSNRTFLRYTILVWIFLLVSNFTLDTNKHSQSRTIAIKSSVWGYKKCLYKKHYLIFCRNKKQWLDLFPHVSNAFFRTMLCARCAMLWYERFDSYLEHVKDDVSTLTRILPKSEVMRGVTERWRFESCLSYKTRDAIY